MADPLPDVGDDAQALVKARETGQPVEILSQRSETAQVFAEPDGNQRTVISARPTRVKKDSTWVEAEPGLVVRKDGSLGPEAATIDLAFSRGGSGPMVRIVKNGASLAYTWPTPLPAPSIEGRIATYAEVIPGVDLVLSADVEGFSQVLVVKTAEAASRPELAELRVATQVGGGTLNLDKSGNLTLIATDGTVAFHGNAPQMWDSSGTVEESGDRVVGPRTGDAIGELAARLEGETLILTPNQGFLRAPGLTFPLYIDPPMHGAGRLAFAYVSKHFSTTKYYGTSDVAKVGYYNDPNVPSGPTIDTYRSFFRMNTAAVNGKHIIKATFRTYETYSWSCTKRSVQLWLTGAIGTGTTWKAQPSWKRQISAVNAAKGYSGCAAGGVDFDATSAVVEAAGAKWSNLTLGLRAASESDKLGWKKFRNNPSIEITYNTKPNVPDQRSTEVGASAAVPCATGTATPYVTTLTPTLRARVSDADSNKGQTVRALFEWHVTGGAKIGERYTAYVASGTPVTAPIPTGAFTDGANVSWRVRGQDGVAISGSSDWSPWCSMIIDRTRPSSAPTVASADYPETPEGGDPIPSGGVGRMGVFTITPGPVTDVGGYLYALNNDDPGSATSLTAAANGTATVKVTPSRDLLNVLYVWSRDKAGNVGPYKRYEFSVRIGTAPLAHWKLDETTGTQASDVSGNGYHATLTDGATWTPGRHSGGVRLNGVQAKIMPQKTDAMVRTDANFSVTAWVKLAHKNGANQTVISQDGVNRSAFFLQYNKTQDRWAMVMSSADSTGTVTYPMAISNTSPQIGVWTHLLGSFDAATGSLTLFVDGRQQTATGVQSTPWHGAGRFAIGRALGVSDPFAGDVDSVRAWDRTVYRAEAASLASHPAIREGHWQLDETSGSVAADSSGKNRPATASGGYLWSDGWIGGGADFAGTDGQMVTAGPVLRTDSSFSVAAWVKLAGKTDYHTAVSQDGVHRSGFYLQYDKVQDRWRFNMPASDTSTTNDYIGPFSVNPAEVGVWTHLVGVYDKANSELRLYVDGNRESVTAFNTPWNSTGPLAIGRAIHGWNRWSGGVDDVRVYTGVLTDDEIYDLAMQ